MNKKTPVLFFHFRRKNAALKVLERIRKYRPDTLLLVSDAAREGMAQEQNAVEETKRAILESIDWDCTIEKHFAEGNMGVRKRISSGISLCFEKYERAIILEDDCVPDHSFFMFCDEMLERYSDDGRIMSVNGTSFFDDDERISDYWFSRHNHCWGWATWRRSWQFYDDAMLEWPSLRNGNWLLDCLHGNAKAATYWKQRFDKVYSNEIQSWAYRWRYSSFLRNGASVSPYVNLVGNMGFGDDSDNFQWKLDPLLNRPVKSLSFPLVDPDTVSVDVALDNIVHDRAYGETIAVKAIRRLHKNKILHPILERLHV